MKKETTVEAHKFIHKYTPSNLINEMDDCQGKYKLLKSAKKGKETLNGPMNIKHLVTSQKPTTP